MIVLLRNTGIMAIIVLCEMHSQQGERQDNGALENRNRNRRKSNRSLSGTAARAAAIQHC
jgi:hypothetical protein